MTMTELLFTGDLFLGGDLHGKEARNVVRSIAFQTADKRIVNLEQPISNNNKVADKCTLYTNSFAVDQLNELKIDVVNLAHNHIQDKEEEEGIIETIAFLSQSEIGHFGAGKNISEAQKPFWINDKLCVLGFCEFNRPYLKQIRLANEKRLSQQPWKLKWRFPAQIWHNGFGKQPKPYREVTANVSIPQEGRSVDRKEYLSVTNGAINSIRFTGSCERTI